MTDAQQLIKKYVQVIVLFGRQQVWRSTVAFTACKCFVYVPPLSLGVTCVDDYFCCVVRAHAKQAGSECLYRLLVFQNLAHSRVIQQDCINSYTFQLNQ